MNLLKKPETFVWILFFVILASCSSNKTDLGSPVIIEIDTTNIDNTGPVNVESYGLNFTEFYNQRELEHFENWGPPLIRNQKLIFYNIEGAKKEHQYFAVFNEGKTDLIESFETNVESGIIYALHYFESTGNYVILYLFRKIGIYNHSSDEFILNKTDWNCHSGIANSDTTMVVLGVEGPEKEQVPSLIEISDKGEIGRIVSFPDRTLSKLSAHTEKLFFYNNSIFWFSRKDLSLFKVDKDFNIRPVLKVGAENMVSYEEESDPYKFSPLEMNKFVNRTYVHPGMKLMGDHLILHLRIDTKSYTLVINLVSLEYQLNKDFRLKNKDGIILSTYVGYPPSVSVVVPVIEDYEDHIFKTAQSVPDYKGPSAIYIK